MSEEMTTGKGFPRRIAACAGMLALGAGAAFAAPELAVIEDGAFNGVVVRPDKRDGRARFAMCQFSGLIEKATGDAPTPLRDAGTPRFRGQWPWQMGLSKGAFLHARKAGGTRA